MKSIHINVENLKCGGCASTIEKGLNRIPGVTKVIVDTDSGSVEVIGLGFDEEELRKRLKKMGYPESGSVHGIEKVSAGVKSYVSCAIGKINK